MSVKGFAFILPFLPFKSRYQLQAIGDTALPEVELFQSSESATVGESVAFIVSATDDTGISSLGLTIDGEAIALDPNGRTRLDFNESGTYTIEAIATDRSGKQATVAIDFPVYNAGNGMAPTVSLATDFGEGLITEATDLVGTVDDVDLDYYTLAVAPVSGGEFVEFFRDDDPNPIENGLLGAIDPATLINDSYRLRLTAIDLEGNSAFTDETVHIGGEFKLGHLELSYTDWFDTLDGVPVKITRSYDSRLADATERLGYGWRLEMLDTDLRTSLPPDDVFNELGRPTIAFEEGTRVYVTTPDGKRESFTFEPRPDFINSYLKVSAPPQSPDPDIAEKFDREFGSRDPGIYHPAFVPDDPNSTSQLTVPDFNLQKVGNQYYGWAIGEPYNPANPFFGGQYVLETGDGIEYVIDGQSGDLVKAIGESGGEVYFTENGVSSESGVQITFDRDREGRITAVDVPGANDAVYRYDAAGDLVSAKAFDYEDLQMETTQFVYSEDPAHWIVRVINSEGGVEVYQTGNGTVNRPPEIEPDTFFTHEGLEKQISLSDLVRDPDGDSLAYSVENVTNGTVSLASDGETAVFIPDVDIDGSASFELVVDDGFDNPVRQTISLEVSDAPLVRLDFVDRATVLDAGETTELVVVGDFADEKDVVLPDSYLDYDSDAIAVATFDETGLVTAIADGVSVLRASRGPVQAVTALRVGELPPPTTEDEFNVSLAESYGLDVYPPAITLAEGIQRQLLVGIAGLEDSPDLKFGDAGTRYYAGNTEVLEISEDGRISVKQTGIADVTVVHGGAETLIPLLVDIPVPGPDVVTEEGGAIA